MKRFAALLLVLAFCFALGGCSLAKAYLVMKDVKELAQEPEAGREVEVKIVHGFDPETMNCWPDLWEGITSEEMACSVANALFTPYQQIEKDRVCRLQFIQHDIDNDIWIADFSPDDFVPGEGLTIAFDGKTAGVIGVWPGE